MWLIFNIVLCHRIRGIILLIYYEKQYHNRHRHAIPYDKIRIGVPNRYEVTQKLHVILLPFVYDLCKVNRRREMIGEIVSASLVR